MERSMWNSNTPKCLVLASERPPGRRAWAVAGLRAAETNASPAESSSLLDCWYVNQSPWSTIQGRLQLENGAWFHV